MSIGIIGTSIWQQNNRLLHQMTLSPESKQAKLDELKEVLGVDELIYLSTCNRIEILYSAPESIQRSQVLHRMIDFFFKGAEDIAFFPNDFYNFRGREALMHLFRMVSSLESMVIGETQITGQFKQAYNDAKEYGLVGHTLDHLAQRALLVARSIKRKTSIGRGSLSMASLAGETISKQLKDIQNPTIALVGAGPMTSKLAKYIKDSFQAELLFVNRTVNKAEKLSDEFGGSVVALDTFLESPIKIDAIISATSSDRPIFTKSFIDKFDPDSLPTICIDLAIPRDFSNEFDSTPDLEMIDIPQLKNQHQGNLREKFIEAGHANEIVREEVSRYLSNQIEISLKPIINESYQESIEMANKALDKLFTNKLSSLDKKQQDAVSHLVTKLIGHSSFQSVRMLSEYMVEAKAENHAKHPGIRRKKSA
ncbi:MAG: glutamyl-tRNA reductase [candidate division Zixibacteria bacterium]|nr:glutamyl-tRNA reductase [candidate division Zixibacteria bacterium]